MFQIISTDHNDDDDDDDDDDVLIQFISNRIKGKINKMKKSRVKHYQYKEHF